jgi:hypothetical protein
LSEFLKEGALILRDIELWRVRYITKARESLLTSLSYSCPHICSHFPGVWRPDLAEPKFLGDFPAIEGHNSDKASNYRTGGKEIDLSDLTCSYWEFMRAYLSLLLLYLGAILNHTHYSSISIPDLSISCTKVSYIFK